MLLAVCQAGPSLLEQDIKNLNNPLPPGAMPHVAQSQAFLRPFEARIAFKKAAARLQLVATVLPSVGIAAGDSSGEGFQLESVMTFAAPCFSHKEAVVRSSAVALTAALARVAGPGVQRLLPGDLNPKLREQIQAEILAAASGNAEGSTVAAAAPLARAVKPALATAKALAPKPAAAAAAPAAAAVPDPPGLLGSPGSLLPGEDDDPAPYQAELAAREVRLGPRHPDVAEALSNLAIIHNQVGCGLGTHPLQCLESQWLRCSPPIKDKVESNPLCCPRSASGLHCSVATRRQRCRCMSERWASGKQHWGQTILMSRTR